MSVKNLAQFGVNAVQHQDPEVRQAGQELVLLLYKVMLQYLKTFVEKKLCRLIRMQLGKKCQRTTPVTGENKQK